MLKLLGTFLIISHLSITETKNNSNIMTHKNCSWFDVVFGTFQGVFGLDHGVQWRRFDSFGQKVSNGSKSQQLDAQSDFMQRSPEDLWSHVSLEPSETSNKHVSQSV